MNYSRKFYSTLLIIIGASILVYAYSTGITGVTRKNGNGCTCHNALPSSNVIVTILGPDTLAINQSAQYSITITGGPLVRAGTDIAVSSGTLAPLGTDLRLDQSDGELTHTLPKAPSGGVVTFSFTYTAPAFPGSVTMYANGNSVNFNGINDPGDEWNFAPNKNIVINSVMGIKNINPVNNFVLNQNYPNPFNPSTIISYVLKESDFVTLKIYDTFGREIETLVNKYETAGSYSVSFNMNLKGRNGELPSGIYLYELREGNFVSVKKMILMK